MKILVKWRWRTFFTNFGYGWEVWTEYPGNLSFYETIEDEMGDPEYDLHVIKPQIGFWLESNLWNSRYHVTYERWGDKRGFLPWSRPILFRRFRDVQLFYKYFGT